MNRPRRGRRPAPAGRAVPRTARLNEVLREIVAEELTLIGDERLEHISITGVDADSELNHAVVFFDSFAGPDADPEILEALGERRVRLQSAIGRQMKARRTPILQFRPDDVIRSAERIDAILRDLRTDEGGEVEVAAGEDAGELAAWDDAEDDDLDAEDAEGRSGTA